MLTLTDDAWARYGEIFDTIEAERLAERETNGSYAEWLGKAPNGHILRIAALFELIEDTNATEISATSVVRAIQLYQWLRLEARSALGIASGDKLTLDIEHAALAYIADQRSRRTKPGDFSHILARDLMRGPRKFRGDMHAHEVEAVLTQLEGAGWLTQCPPPVDEAGKSRTDAQTWWYIRPDFEAVWGARRA